MQQLSAIIDRRRDRSLLHSQSRAAAKDRLAWSFRRREGKPVGRQCGPVDKKKWKRSGYVRRWKQEREQSPPQPNDGEHKFGPRRYPGNGRLR
jgi:hypothetical protein